MHRAFGGSLQHVGPRKSHLRFEALEDRRVLDSVVVFNEIMYHPPASEETLEWIELYNEQAVDMDISGWSLRGGVDYTFSGATILGGGDYLVIAISPADLQSATGFTGALGPFTGRLANQGEQLELVNNSGRVMDTVEYGDDGDWPVAPDGSGVSLAKYDVDAGSADPSNWIASEQIGGTPGARNFVFSPNAPAVVFNEIAAATDTSFGLELYNDSAANIDLSGYVVTRSGATTADYVLPAQTLVPAGYLALSAAQIGFTAAEGEKLFLYAPGKARVLDAIVVKNAARGRTPPGTGPWFYVEHTTLSAANSFVFHDEIVINEIMYHHRPRRDRPATVVETPVLAIDAPWKYDDSGVDRGSDWKNIGYDDSAWATGAALLYDENATLPAPKNTPLAAGHNTYYFRTSFTFGGDPTDVQLSLNPIVDDGAAFYLNGVEVYRFNMPAGDIEYGTLAVAVVGNAAYSGPVLVPAAGLVVGTNVLAVEVHQAISTSGDGVVIAPQAGFEITWNGNDGDNYSPSNPALVPDNAARATHGVTPFGSTQHPNYPLSNVNDGRYGDSRSWAPNYTVGDPNPYVGLKFNQTLGLTTIAWGRDNGNTADSCGTCTNRSLGTYTLQFTTVANPITAQETGDPATGWKAIGAVAYNSPSDGFTPHLRHLYSVSQAGGPILATGLRIKLSDDDIAIDEIEINAAGGSGTGAIADAVFGTTLSTVVTTSPATQAGENDEEWVELYNRSATSFDLTGWRFDDGIDFDFAPGTMIPAGGYLVVAKDRAALLAQHPTIAVVGDFRGSLANDADHIVLKDSRNNPVDDLRYYDGGPWPMYADGGGSSLELRDPDADNSVAEAWVASDESGKSSWRTYTYRGVLTSSVNNSAIDDRWKEFVMGLFGDGEILLDNLSVVEFPSGAATQKLINRTFESDTIGQSPASWRINGNHRTSRVEADPDQPGQKVLHLISTGETSDRFNHAETTFLGNVAVVNGREYEISFRARWLAGTDQFNTRLYFDRLARRITLDVPQQNGTPGLPNSRAVANIGPTYGELRHSPVVPNINQAVTVSVAAADPDNVASMTLRYAVNGGASNAVAMTHQGNGRYVGTVPGQAAAAIVQFFVEGTDGLGAISTFPAAGASSRALYKVQDNQAQPAGKHTVRIIMTAADTAFMYDLVNVMSSEEYPATVVYDEQWSVPKVFYNVGVTLHGSMDSRPRTDMVSYDVHFHPDERFRGVVENFTIDRSGRVVSARSPQPQEEILLKYAMLAAGGILSTYDDLVYVVAPHSAENDSALLVMSAYDNDMLDSQFDRGSDGTQFGYDFIYYQQNTTNGLPDGLKTTANFNNLPNAVDLADLGDDKEAYRWNFRIQNNRDQDDYSRLIEFLKAMSLPGSQPGGALDLATRDLMDVDQWMRVFAALSLGGEQIDVYGRGASNKHNLRLYVRPEDNRVLVFPWDWDNVVFRGNTATDLFPAVGNNLRKVVDIPGNKHLFFGHLQDLMNTTFNRSYLTSWTNHYSSLLPGQNFSGALTYLDNRNAFSTSQLPPSVPFSATTGDAIVTATLLDENVAAKALVPSTANGGDLLGTSWTAIGFNDAGWLAGTTGVGYENSPSDPTNYSSLLHLNTSSMFNTNESVFVRLPFNFSGNVADIDRLRLQMKYDDGFVAYLNGVKVAEANAPGTVTWNSGATAIHDDTAAVVFQDFDISAFKNLLVSGQNVLAIHGLNRLTSSSDMLILPKLVAEDMQSGSENITVDGPIVTLGGSAWINVHEIRLQGQTDPLPLSYPTVTTWQTTIPVPFGNHVLTFEAYDFRGNLVGTDTFSVTSTYSDRPLEDLLRITEVMYHPADPTPAEAAAGFTDQDEFEYIELQNVSSSEVLDLTGVRFTAGIAFDFAVSAVTTLGPGQFALVVANPDAFAARYGGGLPVAGAYSGQLDNGGERVRLVDAVGTVLHDFTYDDATWYPQTDGPGPSLVIRDALAAKSLWSLAAGWRPSIESTGSPGEKDGLLGDLNEDRQAGLVDLALMQIHIGQATGATRSDGDLDGDRAVTRADVAILAAQYGRSYTPPPPPSGASLGATPSAASSAVLGEKRPASESPISSCAGELCLVRSQPKIPTIVTRRATTDTRPAASTSVQIRPLTAIAVDDLFNDGAIDQYDRLAGLSLRASRRRAGPRMSLRLGLEWS